ncbi:MAG: hypothetical protein GY797_24565 [Deltaproteobacteria bacterium]|nr:hypothetical protein [Deltaproteobacteria bacterium]
MKAHDTLSFDSKANLLWRFDAIHGHIDIRDVIDVESKAIIAKLLKSPVLERLRRIKQLGFASQSYPAADHSRYAHALGTMHMMRRLLAHLNFEQTLPDNFFEELIGCFHELTNYNMLVQHLLVTALIQDIGELPFGQVTQYFYRPSDTTRYLVRKKTGIDISGIKDKDIFTIACLYNKETLIPELLTGLSLHFLVFLLTGLLPSEMNINQSIRSHLKRLRNMLDSAVDADRLDYVFRDAHDTVGGLGTSQAIVESLLNYDEFGPIFSDPGPVSHFLTARAYLFSTVYGAPANRFHMILLANFLQGVANEKACADEFFKEHQRKLTTEDFLEIDDVSLNAKITLFVSHSTLKRKLNLKARNALELLIGNGVEYQCFWLPPGKNEEQCSDMDLPDELFFDAFYDQRQRIVYKPGTIRIDSGRFKHFETPVLLEECSGPFNPIFEASYPILPMSECILLFTPKEKTDRRGKMWEDFDRALGNGTIHEQLKRSETVMSNQTGNIYELGNIKLPFELYQKITDVLTSLPNIHDNAAQRAFIYSAGLDAELVNQISLGAPPMQFVQLLVATLGRYGTLVDGRNALAALLEAAKNHIGQEGKAYCDSLIRELHSVVLYSEKYFIKS